MKFLIVLDDPPYGTERSYKRARLTACLRASGRQRAPEGGGRR
jgi:hypothetical protein